MLRVANVIEEGKLAGPQVRMIRVAVALSDKVDTHIILPSSNSEVFRELCDKNSVSYTMLPITRITKEWSVAIRYILQFPWEILRLAHLFRREKIALVHASGGSWQYKAVIAARLVNIPVVWHLNDSLVPRGILWLFRVIATLASGFIFASFRSRDYYSNFISKNSSHSIITSTVDLNFFDPALVHAHIDHLPIKSNTLVIGTVANVSPVKGLETLIRAACVLHEWGYDTHVVIAGPIYKRQSKYYESLLSLARKMGLSQIHFTGGKKDIRALLARFDVYVCSSIAESSPIAVWEAMAMGRPIVSTDVGDVSLHVQDGESGFLVPVNDHVAMADSIKQLLDDPKLRRRFGALARKAAAHFAPDKVANDTLDFYNFIMNANK